MPDVVVSATDLSFRYRQSEVLRNLTFDINAGDYVALAGPNGAGKSTLVRVLLGLESGFRGQVRLFGVSPARFREWHRVGYLPQRVNLFNPLFPATVHEVVGMGLLSGKRYPKHLTHRDTRKIARALEQMKIAELYQRPVSELSVGQQQRLFMARALVGSPEILVLDEPSGALDPQSRGEFFTLLRTLNQSTGMTVIHITHDITEISEFATTLFFLDRALIFHGSLSNFCLSPAMERYFGRYAQHLICHQHE